MATEQETAAVREVFARLGDIAAHRSPDFPGADPGSPRGRLAYSLHTAVAHAHSLAGIILDMDRIESEKVPDGPLAW